jgi:hypothetical protein
MTSWPPCSRNDGSRLAGNVLPYDAAEKRRLVTAARPRNGRPGVACFGPKPTVNNGDRPLATVCDGWLPSDTAEKTPFGNGRTTAERPPDAACFGPKRTVCQNDRPLVAVYDGWLASADRFGNLCNRTIRLSQFIIVFNPFGLAKSPPITIRCRIPSLGTKSPFIIS